jgi:hypothetical protein
MFIFGSLALGMRVKISRPQVQALKSPGDLVRGRFQFKGKLMAMGNPVISILLSLLHS